MALFTPPAVFAPPPINQAPAQVCHVPARSAQWNRPVFRPPSLPTQAQIWSELPFTARYQRKSLAAGK